MKSVIDAQILAKSLKRISPIIKKNTVLPILTCVKLSFDKKQVVLSATDLETTALLTMDCECKNPFSVVIEFSDLIDLCGKISGLITIELIGKEIHITSENSKFKFTQTNETEHFPIIKEEEFLFGFEVDSDFFLSLVNANNCKSPDQFKMNMNAACIHIKKEVLSLIGTDAYVAYKKDLKIKSDNELQIMVNEPFIHLAKGFIAGKIFVGDKFIKCETTDIVLISRLQDSKFCQYEVIIPKEIEYNLKTDRASLINSISLAGVSANKTTHLCSINFNGGDIKIISEDVDYGKEGECRIASQHSVKIKSIGVSGIQMLKLLNLFDSEEIEMAFREENNTIFLRPLGEPNTLCLLQPLSLIN